MGSCATIFQLKAKELDLEPGSGKPLALTSINAITPTICLQDFGNKLFETIEPRTFADIAWSDVV